MMTADEAIAIAREEFAKKHNIFPCPSCGASIDENGNILISQDRHERFIILPRKKEIMKSETIILKNLFSAFAADIEKVANEALGPRTDTRVCVPPEVIDYWLKHIEMIMEVDTLSLLGNEEKCLRTVYARYVLENHKMRMISSKIGWPLSFDEWWRQKADNAKDEAKYT